MPILCHIWSPDCMVDGINIYYSLVKECPPPMFCPISSIQGKFPDNKVNVGMFCGY